MLTVELSLDESTLFGGTHDGDILAWKLDTYTYVITENAFFVLLLIR